MNQPWWKRSVVYQIYPRSFCDSDGDGVGDLPGITARLDHLQQLGVDVVWLSPVYASPNDDNGYDISDYRAIMREFGTMADFDAMLQAMRDRGIKLMMDLVVNHTSDEHRWFEQARSSRDNPYHDYYIWRQPRAEGAPGHPDRREPTNWEAAFSGSAWQWNAATGQYYLHMFSPKQPDLNWENPKVRAEVFELMRFWLDKGVAGFRMDVINMISKPFGADGSLPDAPVVRDGFLQPSFQMVTNGPRLLEFLREMKTEVLSHYDTISVGEAPLATTRQGIEITDPDSGALNMLFQFEHMDLDSVGGHVMGKWAFKPLDLRDLKATMSRWQHALAGRGWNSLYLSNHDQPRPVSRFGDDGRWRVESAKMLGTWLHLQQGTPYVYQGEELGMTNVPFDSIGDYRDIETLNMYREAVEAGADPAGLMRAIQTKGRDNARTPMPWTGGDNAGFTTGTPWIRIDPSYTAINAEQAVADPDSVFHHYRRLIALRREHAVIIDGRYDLLLPEDRQIYAYTRTLDGTVLLVVCNFSAQALRFDWPDALADAAQGAAPQLLITNLPVDDADPRAGFALRPYEARAYLATRSGAAALAGAHPGANPGAHPGAHPGADASAHPGADTSPDSSAATGANAPADR